MDGRLLLGLPVNGKRYFDFKVHLLTLGDECNALELVADLGILSEDKPLKQAERMLFELAYLCQQVEFIGVDKKQITPAYLLDNLAADDYVIINEAILNLKKKHIDAGESQHQEDSLAAPTMT
ncbi:hypothetical protein [Avibacterium paragallinarum]|uniref:Uncharacterized protein n=1 Tax=Avibacterium paragallinarum TaxID=728 RepID=A0ABU7QL49_AVIPA